MAFIRYVKSGRVYRPIASLWSRGQIGFNRGAVQKFKIADRKFAVLFFDKETRRIGVLLTDDETEEGATALIKGKTGVFISATSFLDYHNIDHQVTRRYPLDFDAAENMYIIDLEKPMAKKESRQLPRTTEGS